MQSKGKEDVVEEELSWGDVERGGRASRVDHSLEVSRGAAKILQVVI